VWNPRANGDAKLCEIQCGMHFRRLARPRAGVQLSLSSRLLRFYRLHGKIVNFISRRLPSERCCEISAGSILLPTKRIKISTYLSKYLVPFVIVIYVVNQERDTKAACSFKSTNSVISLFVLCEWKSCLHNGWTNGWATLQIIFNMMQQMKHDIISHIDSKIDSLKKIYPQTVSFFL